MKIRGTLFSSFAESMLKKMASISEVTKTWRVYQEIKIIKMSQERDNTCLSTR